MSLVKLFSDLKSFVKSGDEVIDSPLFRIHTVFTTLLLCSASMIITATQYVGKPIECLVGGLPNKPVNTYCWIMGTFTVPDAFDKRIGQQVAHPGIVNHLAPIAPDFQFEDENKLDDKKLLTEKEWYRQHKEKFSAPTLPSIKYHSYYQWVCFVLFFQGMACYFPKMLWEAWEGDLMHTLVTGQNHNLCHAEERNKKKRVLLNYLLLHIKTHRSYALKYWLCEGLCLFNVMCQLYLMDRFFDGQFMSYGLDAIKFTTGPSTDAMTRVFPKVAKCIFRKYGASGTIQTHDALCVLALNNINEKTYLILWYWFVAQAVMLIALMMYRLSMMFCRSIRPRLLTARGRLRISQNEVHQVVTQMDIGDWWLLYMLGKNLDPRVFRDLVLDLSLRMSQSYDIYSAPTLKR